VKNATDNLELTTVKQRLGKSTGLEVLRAQTNASQARLNLMNAEQGLQTASEAFKAALGIDDPVVVKPEPVDTNPPTDQFSSFDDYWRAMEQANPSLQIAEKSLKAAELGRKVAWGRLLPSLSFSVSEHYGDSMLPSRTNKWSNNDATSWGFNLGLPILNVKDIVLGIRDANIAVERARIARRSSEIQLQQTAISARLNYDQSRRQVAYAAENLHLNQELYRQAQEQYRLGQLTQLDLFTVETGLSQARVSYLSALADVRVRQAQIDYLLGK
jgi:outer membrane protein TolC